MVPMTRPAAAARYLWRSQCAGWRNIRRHPVAVSFASLCAVLALVGGGHPCAALALALASLVLLAPDW